MRFYFFSVARLTFAAASSGETPTSDVAPSANLKEAVTYASESAAVSTSATEGSRPIAKRHLTLSSAFFCVNLIAPWLTRPELFQIPLNILLEEDLPDDNEAVKDMKRRARIGYSAIQAASCKSGTALSNVLLKEPSINRIVRDLQRTRWQYPKLVGSSDISVDSDKVLILKVLEDFRDVLLDKSRPFVAYMPLPIRTAPVEVYHREFYKPVEGFEPQTERENFAAESRILWWKVLTAVT